MSPKVGLLVAGSMALHSLPDLFIGPTAVTAANILGSTLLHYAARTGGTRLVARLQRRRGSGDSTLLERWRLKLGGHDAAAVFLGRIVPMVRIYVTVAAGLARMSWRHFLLGSAPAGLVWSGTPLLLGYCFRGSVSEFTTGGSMLSRAFFIAVPMIGVVMLAVWLIKRKLAPAPQLASTAV
jgi:membrane protein DedA with SNARE-associated domain